MTDRATGDRDPFAVWLEASRSALSAAPMNEPLRERCESLFGAWARFAETYAEASGVREPPTGDGQRDATGPGATGGPFDPLAWMDAASGGGFGDLWRWFGADHAGWQAERDAILGSREWGAYALALGRYQAVMAEAWLAAFHRFSESLAREHSAGNAGAELPAWETLRARWQDAADDELARAMRSDAFLAAQRDLLRARLDCAAHIRRRLEGLAEAFGMPTRSEVDALAERVHDLSREVRTLQAGTRGKR